MLKHSVGLKSSRALSEIGNRIINESLENRISSNDYQQFFSLYIPEVTAGFIATPVDAAGLSGSLATIVEGCRKTIASSWQPLHKRLQANADDQALISLNGFVRSVYHHDEQEKGIIAAHVEPDFFNGIRQTLSRLPEQGTNEQRAELHNVLDRLIELLLDDMMMASFTPFRPNLLVRKACSAARFSCRAAGHHVLNRVLTKLDTQQIQNLAFHLEDEMLFELWRD